MRTNSKTKQLNYFKINYEQEKQLRRDIYRLKIEGKTMNAYNWYHPSTQLKMAQNGLQKHREN